MIFERLCTCFCVLLSFGAIKKVIWLKKLSKSRDNPKITSIWPSEGLYKAGRTRLEPPQNDACIGVSQKYARALAMTTPSRSETLQTSSRNILEP